MQQGVPNSFQITVSIWVTCGVCAIRCYWQHDVCTKVVGYKTQEKAQDLLENGS